MIPCNFTLDMRALGRQRPTLAFFHLHLGVIERHHSTFAAVVFRVAVGMRLHCNTTIDCLTLKLHQSNQ